jgi:hypothetical protein
MTDGWTATMTDSPPRVATGAVSIADDNMEQLDSTEPIFPQGIEGQFRVTALFLESDTRVALVSCDCLVVTADMARRANERIAAAGWAPRDNILICPTHTHQGHSTVDVLGLVSNGEFVRRIETGIVLAVGQAAGKLDDPTDSSDLHAEMLLGLTQETTVGRNSRLLLKDGSIGWWGYRREDVVRPTGPFDPDIPLLAFRRRDGSWAGFIYSRACHNIGALRADVHSPCVYGLVAGEFEARHGAPTLYFPGAIGSSHNVTYEGSGVPTDEAIVRLLDALEWGLEHTEPGLLGPIGCLRRPFTYRVRRFDEAAEDAKVVCYSRRYLGASAEGNIEVMRGQRAQLAPFQGQERHSFLHAVLLGQIAIVGVPCELFARLGLEIRRRSPFRHTLVLGLANDDFGYVGDREALRRGGYQMWVSPHCPGEEGTGEAMVDQAVEMLRELQPACG